MKELEKDEKAVEEESIQTQNSKPESDEKAAPESVKKECCRKKKLMKIGLISLGGLIVLLIIISISLGLIIKGAVNHVLPKITGTPVSMGSCYLNLFTGTLNIKNFIIGNPENYATPHAFKLAEVHVDIGLTSLLSDKIIIVQILVDGMEVSFESKLTETNIGVIKDNIDSFSKKDESGESDSAETAEAEEDTEGGIKLQIDDFKFINSKITVHIGAGVDVPLPNIEMTGIGAESEDGASVSAVTEEVFSALYIAIIESVQSVGNIDIGDLQDGAVETIKEGINVFKGLIGGSGDEE